MSDIIFGAVLLLIVLALGWALFYVPPTNWDHDHPQAGASE